MHTPGDMKRIAFLVAVALGLALGVSCSGSSSLPSDNNGEGGSGGTGGAACKRMEYASAGCGVSPICTNGTGGACYQQVCGCSGTVMAGCGLFPEPYAYVITADDAGATCDPSAGPGH